MKSFQPFSNHPFSSKMFMKLVLIFSIAISAASLLCMDGDIDGDGISNQDEVSYYGTDPFLSNDTDGDGYLNADETTARTDPDSATSKPFDPANPPLANRYVVPLSWWVENKFGDTLEALNARGESSRLTQHTATATAMADGSYDLPYLSIQAAVNAAAAGDVIQVAPGTYDEAVNLTARNVKLISRRGGREETIIRPPTNAAQGILLGPAIRRLRWSVDSA